MSHMQKFVAISSLKFAWEWNEISIEFESWYYKYVTGEMSLGKIFTSPIYKLLLSFASFQMFTGPLFEIKLHLLSTVLLSGFQSSPGAMKSTK